MSSRRNYRANRTVPDELIDTLFGRGWGYDDWKAHLEGEYNITWSGSLKNTIIKREFLYFQSEILDLKSRTTQERGRRDQPKPNSLESILKRLKGQIWMQGIPSEKKQRLRDGRLLGKDARIRSLQNHVRDWEDNARIDPMPAFPERRNLRNFHPGVVSSTSTTSQLGVYAPDGDFADLNLDELIDSLSINSSASQNPNATQTVTYHSAGHGNSHRSQPHTHIVNPSWLESPTDDFYVETAESMYSNMMQEVYPMYHSSVGWAENDPYAGFCAKDDNGIDTQGDGI